MINKALEMILYAMLFLTVLSMCTARPPQGFSDQTSQGVSGPSADLDATRNLLDTGDDITALKMQLLAQQLAEYNSLQPLSGLPDRFVLSKRQQRYRQCYFNPISCFRK